MGFVLDAGRDGLAGLPPDFEPVARDGLGDVLAAGPDGRVFTFVHGLGDWSRRHLAFASRAALLQFVTQQDLLEIADDADEAWCKDRKTRLAALRKEHGKSPAAKAAIAEALEELRERLEHLRWTRSPRGRAVLGGQQIAQECYAELRRDGANAGLLIGPHVDEPGRVLVVAGAVDPPWSEAEAIATIRRIVDGRREVQFRFGAP